MKILNGHGRNRSQHGDIRWPASYQEANMATENKIWPLSNFVLFLRTCDTKRRCENETNRWKKHHPPRGITQKVFIHLPPSIDRSKGKKKTYNFSVRWFWIWSVLRGGKFDGIEAVEHVFLRGVHLTKMSENRANSESDNSISIRLITMNDISIES